jgi:hypothetical protein
MCGPAGVFLQGMGALSSANAAKAGAESSQSQLNFQANLADINARMSETQAQQTLLTGQREEQKARIATANLKGTQRASLTANGVDLGVGSAAQILTSTDFMGEVDAETIQANAIKSAWGYRTQGANQKAQADSSRAAASAISPDSAFASSLIGGAGQVASSWYQYSNNAPGSVTTTDPRAGVRGQKGY